MRSIKGNEIVVAMAGKPVAKLIPIEKKRKRRPGALKGKIKIAKNFDAPLDFCFTNASNN